MIPARQARCAGLSGCNPSHRCLPSPRVTLLAMPALCRLLSEGGISARIELPGREPWAGTCERRSVEQRRNGVSVGKLRLWGGSGFAVGWGWGEEEGMGKAREVFSRKESSWEKKIPHLGSYWLLGVLFRKQRIRKRTQHKASRVLQNIRPFSLSFFFFSWWRVGISPLSCPQLRKRKNGLCFTNGQTVRPRSNVCFSPQKPCCTTWCYFHRQLK